MVSIRNKIISLINNVSNKVKVVKLFIKQYVLTVLTITIIISLLFTVEYKAFFGVLKCVNIFIKSCCTISV